MYSAPVISMEYDGAVSLVHLLGGDQSQVAWRPGIRSGWALALARARCRDTSSMAWHAVPARGTPLTTYARV